jgi:hypothetical protein
VSAPPDSITQCGKPRPFPKLGRGFSLRAMLHSAPVATHPRRTFVASPGPSTIGGGSGCYCRCGTSLWQTQLMTMPG